MINTAPNSRSTYESPQEFLLLKSPDSIFGDEASSFKTNKSI
ncbi:hypothetical protein OHAE_4873 [Ochrobactrum soli]|uniref:Uncharacterized protein n=1 Tax=Ochrobactrum soli TaxID=2448455 RepID=A0A2P9HDE5_9HYPH|nr:hypothetical protein OHAE_4873 [[Ochrobactrum] soli]